MHEVVARGCLVVAAVGNDGPAARPLYPAAWPGVVGVTGVDARGRVLAEAERGVQVKFAAPGADMVAARTAAGYLRGAWHLVCVADRCGPAGAHSVGTGQERSERAVAALRAPRSTPGARYGSRSGLRLRSGRYGAD